MIIKFYEVTCDKCNRIINQYIGYKPSLKRLRTDAGLVKINNGSVKVYCKKCAKEL